MIDPDVDPDRAANARAEEFAARRARRRAMLAAGKLSQRRNVGHLATMYSAPPPKADVGTLAETVAVIAPVKDDGPTENASIVFGSATQLLAAAVLVAVLLVAWFVERHSARK